MKEPIRLRPSGLTFWIFIKVFDFCLDADDMAKIKVLDTKKSTIYDEMDPKMAFYIGQRKIHGGWMKAKKPRPFGTACIIGTEWIS